MNETLAPFRKDGFSKIPRESSKPILSLPKSINGKVQINWKYTFASEVAKYLIIIEGERGFQKIDSTKLSLTLSVAYNDAHLIPGFHRFQVAAYDNTGKIIGAVSKYSAWIRCSAAGILQPELSKPHACNGEVTLKWTFKDKGADILYHVYEYDTEGKLSEYQTKDMSMVLSVGRSKRCNLLPKPYRFFVRATNTEGDVGEPSLASFPPTDCLTAFRKYIWTNKQVYTVYY